MIEVYKPPGSDKESAFFKNTSREAIQRRSQLMRKDWVDPNYQPKMTQVRKKPICMVKIDAGLTTKKLNKKAKNLCSKGELECRISNRRLAN
jgi:hypothetical protein